MVTKAVVSHYYSGQGRLSAGLRGVDGQPLGLRPVGNVNELTLTISGDTTTIQRPVNGKLVDMEVYTKSTSIKVDAKLESATARNLAMLTHGAFGDARAEYILDPNARGYFGALQPLRGMAVSNMSARLGGTQLTAYQDDATPWDFMPSDGGAGLILNDGMDAPVDKLATLGTTVTSTMVTDAEGVTRFMTTVPDGITAGQRVMLTGFTNATLAPYNNRAATIVGCSSTYVDLMLGNAPIALAGNPGRILFDGANLSLAYTSGPYSQYTATTDLGGEFYLRFDGLNLADDSSPVTVEIWRVKLDPSCVRNLLNEELEQFSLQGKVLYDRFRPFTPFYTEKFRHLTSQGALDAPMGDTGFFRGWDSGAGGGPGGGDSGNSGGGTGSGTFPSVDWLTEYLNGSLGEAQFAADVLELLHTGQEVKDTIEPILDDINQTLTTQENKVDNLTAQADGFSQQMTDLAAAQTAQAQQQSQDLQALADTTQDKVDTLTAAAQAAQDTANQALADLADEAGIRSGAISDLTINQAAQTVRLQQTSDALAEEQSVRAAAITALQSAIADLADATALSALETRVEAVEGSITSNSSAITGLTNRIHDTETDVDQLQSDVSLQSNAINTLTSRVSDDEDELASLSAATTSLDNRLNTVEVDLAGTMATVDATSTALDSLTNRVDAAEGTIEANSSAITSLSNTINSATSGLATKASASALAALDTRVTVLDGTVSSISTDVTSLQNRIDNPTTGLDAKASATALQSLTNEVHDDDTGLATKASSAALTALTNTVNSSVNGLPSKASASALQALETRVTAVEAETTATTDLSARLDTVEGALVNEMITRASQTSALSSAVNTLSSRLGTAEGNITNTADAVDSLTTRVDSAEGQLSSQSTSLTQLQAQVNAIDADTGGAGAAISALDTRVTAAENTLVSQGNAITSLQNSVTSANKVFIQDTPPDTAGRTTNDLWINTTGGANTLYGFDGTAWVKRQDASKNTVFVQGTAPTANAVNDLWFDTSRNNRQFRWNGSAWVEITDTRIAANATAITNLTTRVSTAEGNITSQGSSITSLQNTVNNATTGVAATAAAVSTLSGQVSALGDTVSSQTDDITSLKNTVNNATTGVAATAAALNTLTTRVSATETVNTSQGNSITSLQNTVNNATTGVAATASAVSALTTRVTQAENTNSSQGSAITSLQSTVNNSTTGVAATASAVSALTTRVTTAEGKITTQATTVSQISTTVGGHTASISSLQSSTNGLLLKASVSLDSNGYVTGWALNNNGNSGSMTILASRFAIVAPGTAARTEYSSNNWRVYDSSNRLRVRMGVW